MTLLAPLLALSLALADPVPGTTTPAASELGQQVYARVAHAVFVLDIEDDEGKPVGLGTAFLVRPNELVTNAHVVTGAKIFLRAGPARLPCTVTAIDARQDLALLALGGQLAVDPLPLALTDPEPGSAIFVIGTPAGLERTISDGLISGKREEDGRVLLQLTAPISPGSSGGPLINRDGLVVGVAVGYLTQGQNLNFAIPATTLRAFLEGKPDQSAGSVESLLAEIQRLLAIQAKARTAQDDGSALLQATEQIATLLEQAHYAAAGSPQLLLLVAQTASTAGSEIAIDAAREAIADSRTFLAEAHVLLARELRLRSLFKTEPERTTVLLEAKGHIEKVLQLGRPQDASQLALLGEILKALSLNAEAYTTYRRALTAAETAGKVEKKDYQMGLFRTAGALGRVDEAQQWFDQVAKSGHAGPLDWWELAAFLEERELYARASIAWRRAITSIPANLVYWEWWCNIGKDEYFSDQYDNALAAYRTCIQLGATEKDSEKKLSGAYRHLSAILYERGVYDQAVQYAKQAIASDPEDPWGYLYLSQSLRASQRYAEAVAAATTSVRLTDGRYSSMHFALGSAYFGQEEWERARLAYTKAAELEPTDTAAPYNVALCYQRQGFRVDAARWFEEVLRRDPNHPDKADLQRRIRALRD